MTFDIAYVSSYNEFDCELLSGLRHFFRAKGMTVGVVSYASRYVEELHRSAGYEFLNLRTLEDGTDMPTLTPCQVEASLHESFQELLFPEKQYYQSSDSHLTTRALRIFAAVEWLITQAHFKLVVHKLGAEILRKAMLYYADATKTPSCFFGTFPTVFPGRSYYHRTLACERDFCAPPQLDLGLVPATPSRWIEELRNNRGLITYPSGGARSPSEMWAYIFSAARHSEWEFLSDVIKRRLLLLKYRARGVIGNSVAGSRMPEGKFFFFPLHVFDDSQITVRNPQFFDQYWIIEYISRCLPHGFRLAVKMHPGVDGSVPITFLRKVKALRNVVLLRAGVRASDVIERAAGVIVINSTVALESLLLGKPVLVLGHWAFGNAGVTSHNNDLRELSRNLRDLQHATVDPSRVNAVLQAYSDEMMPGSYYQFPRDWNAIGDSLMKVMAGTKNK